MLPSLHTIQCTPDALIWGETDIEWESITSVKRTRKTLTVRTYRDGTHQARITGTPKETQDLLVKIAPRVRKSTWFIQPPDIMTRVFWGGVLLLGIWMVVRVVQEVASHPNALEELTSSGHEKFLLGVTVFGICGFLFFGSTAFMPQKRTRNRFLDELGLNPAGLPKRDEI